MTTYTSVAKLWKWTPQVSLRDWYNTSRTELRTVGSLSPCVHLSTVFILDPVASWCVVWGCLHHPSPRIRHHFSSSRFDYNRTQVSECLMVALERQSCLHCPVWGCSVLFVLQGNNLLSLICQLPCKGETCFRPSSALNSWTVFAQRDLKQRRPAEVPWHPLPAAKKVSMVALGSPARGPQAGTPREPPRAMVPSTVAVDFTSQTFPRSTNTESEYFICMGGFYPLIHLR